jgi:hypothetical protein
MNGWDALQADVMAITSLTYPLQPNKKILLKISDPALNYEQVLEATNSSNKYSGYPQYLLYICTVSIMAVCTLC